MDAQPSPVLVVIRAAVGELGSVFTFPDEQCRGMVLALDEAMANIIRHAYHGDSTAGRNGLPGSQGPAGVSTMLDQGEPPDPVRLRPHPLDGVSLSGRGTHIIRSIMDEVRYERVPGGNQLRLSKHLPAARRREGERKTL